MLVLPLPAEVVVAAVVEPVVAASPEAAFRRLVVVAGPFSGLEAGGDVGPATLGVDGGAWPLLGLREEVPLLMMMGFITPYCRHLGP
ncbi:hypothetical protein pipiens_001185 [Culex pipiens pipiens]|uniref:Secreted protein n=1 Tax=Culex pipiens pipiens TaxID=38569 RepID=A0ABD1DIC0_CULPP